VERTQPHGASLETFHAAGAELAITWLNERAQAHVEPLVRDVGATITAPLDVSVPRRLRRITGGTVYIDGGTNIVA
jgi:enoyl-[acyl-carrier-protein] reductase (NADH)